MSVRIQLRRDTSANWASLNPVLGAGEIAFSTDTNTIKIGDGSTVWASLATVGLVADGVPLSYTGLSDDVEIVVGSATGETTILAGSGGSALTVIRANSAQTGGVERFTLGLDSLSDVNTSGFATGDLLQYNGSSWVPYSFEEVIFNNQRTVQNIALYQAGYFSRSNSSATVYKWTFPTDSVSATTSAPSSMLRHGGFDNPSVAGYFSRGGETADVYKWAFPADTVSATTSAPATMSYHDGFENDAVAGYFNRGFIGITGYTNIYKWAFPADTVSTTTSAPGILVDNAGCANPAVAGYFSQGNYGTSIYKWTFQADTVSTLTSTTATRQAAFEDPAVAGYFSRASIEVRKLSFSTDTTSTTTSPPVFLRDNGGFSNPTVAGYFSEGTGSTGAGQSSSVYKWAFPTDTVSATTSALASMNRHGGFSNA